MVQKASTLATCDTVTLELIAGALGMAVSEMETLLERTAMSPFIREKKDFHVALADAEGRVIVASGGHTGEFMSAIFEAFPAQEMSAGDIYWYNDCYSSRGIVSHSPDQVFVAPVYFEDRLVGFSQAWAHFNDIGGMHPGTISPDATSIYQEGIIVPVVRLQQGGRRNEDLQRLFERNSRYPQMVRGDIRASLAAVALGERRLAELFDRFGLNVTLAGLEQSFERTASLLTTRFRELFAAGTYSFSEVVATDGKGNGPFNIHMDLTVTPDHVKLDASGTDDQALGPINYLMHVGVPASTLGRYLLSLVPEARANHGVQALIDEVVLRHGSLLQPNPPAALGMRGITAIRSMNCILGIVNQATNGQGGASNSAYVIYNMRGSHAGKPFLLSDGVAIGYGARAFADGIDAVYLVGQKNYPAEFMETVYPIRMRSYGLLKDSGGPGRWRGGCGVFREIEILADEALLSVRIDGVGNPPWGVLGGMPGRGGRAVVNPGRSDERMIEALSDGTVLKRGDVFRIETVGGGGWGNPLERSPEHVRADVLGRFISSASARDDYGVVLTGADLHIDYDATNELRSSSARSAAQGNKVAAA
ncbi:methylhydantoinase [Sphingobium sp. TA15]|uniref:N-methylhydantoinase B n=1 Tax=Sphingobium indicum (strain DSM 16413 / CCM 7287 / MTCC 6362 / UT26 / NBRC 101211 / UT26S) TaxID=452662 RepID=D4Z282_SPHIU|nr:hydantoinase B/oxoprolinase family protein [Sphingobium indicum]BAI96714.1 N-methylhydantoinase B [Sphingobium indicum UT26S]BDD66149.1 methylhydantoinase [Sphingobium sp. TA15]